jgi:eukaryotic-like serine/threonine-protein kinase
MRFDLRTAVAERLGERFAVEQEVGRGGMGMVCRAREAGTGRVVALKVLWPELARAVAGKRFLREIEILRRLTHPNLLPLLDSGLVEVIPGLQVPWLAMPFIEEDTLAGRLTRTPRLDVAEAVQITQDVCAGLGAVHREGLVHRDIKPSNILLRTGSAVVADFGLARAFAVSGVDRVSTTGLLVGTPTYTSPEQSRGDTGIDGRSDLYSLGVVLYEMLAGEPPFSGRDSQVISARHQREPPPRVRILRPEVPAGLEQLLLQVMAKSPAERPATALALSMRLTLSPTR